MQIEMESHVLPTLTFLDDILGGGLERGVITEIYGEGGTGKTNLCMCMAANVIRQGFKVVYVDTEGLPMHRMAQIAGRDMLKDLIVYRPTDWEEQNSAVDEVSRLLERRGDIPLLIVDSLTNFYRLEFGEEAVRDLGRQLLKLQKIARNLNIAVVVTNQVYTDTHEGRIKPIGGHMLQHVAKVILAVERLGDIRVARVEKHRSSMDGAKAYFLITDAGVEAAPYGD